MAQHITNINRKHIKRLKNYCILFSANAVGKVVYVEPVNHSAAIETTESGALTEPITVR